MCLKRDNHVKVCSPACVFQLGFNIFIICSGEYFLWQSGLTWLNTSIILVILSHILSSGGGRGKGVSTALSLSRLHILSYAIVAFKATSSPFCFTKESNHCIRIKKTWEVDSDLQKRTI